jgi:hypothetical protein
MLGGLAGYDFLGNPQQELILELEARQDIANDNGFLATARGIYGGRLSTSWRLDAFVGSVWASEDYMSSYFGITAADAVRSGLDQFDAEEDFKDVNFGGVLTYRFFERWSVAALATYAHLIGDAADSVAASGGRRHQQPDRPDRRWWRESDRGGDWLGNHRRSRGADRGRDRGAAANGSRGTGLDVVERDEQSAHASEGLSGPAASSGDPWRPAAALTLEQGLTANGSAG